MSDICYSCGTPIDKNSEVSFIVSHLINWDGFASVKVGDKFTQKVWNGNSRSYNNGETFTLLQKQTYAQECQGETTDCFLVFRRENTGKTYKKLGKGDSYGEIEWDGAVVEVKVVQKMVPTWEVVA